MFLCDCTNSTELDDGKGKSRIIFTIITKTSTAEGRRRI